MNCEQWLEAKGFDIESLTDAQEEYLKAQWKAEQDDSGADDAPDEGGDVQAGGDAGITGEPDADEEDPVKELRAKHVAEVKRLGAIHEVAGDYPDIEAKAVEEGWSAERAELEVLKASRAPNVHTGRSDDDGTTPKVLEAGIRLGGEEQADVVEEDYDEQTLEAGYDYRQLGTRDLIRICAQMDGVQVPRPGAGVTAFLRAAASSMSLANILGSSANKALVASYRETPSVAKEIAAKLSPNDFKEHTGYRMTGDRRLEKVGPDGELKHANLDETEVYAYSVDTFGRMIVLTRQMITNDDLGAFTQLPKRYGKGAVETLERLFWELVLDNTGSFFGSGNSNLLESADYSLDAGALSSAVQLLE